MKALKNVAMVGLLVGSASAHAVVLANWTFEVSVPTTAGPHAAEIGSGQALGFHNSTSVVYSNPSGNGSLESFSSNFWEVGDYYQFQFSTTGMFGLQFGFDQASSNTGPRDFRLDYSTDGSSFAAGPSYSVLANASPNPTWNTTTYNAIYAFNFDLSSVTALNNQANVWVRLVNTSTVSANGGTVATTGTDRVDNVVASATPVPEPASLLALAAGAAVLARRRRR